MRWWCRGGGVGAAGEQRGGEENVVAGGGMGEQATVSRGTVEPGAVSRREAELGFMTRERGLASGVWRGGGGRGERDSAAALSQHTVHTRNNTEHDQTMCNVL